MAGASVGQAGSTAGCAEQLRAAGVLAAELVGQEIPLEELKAVKLAFAEELRLYHEAFHPVCVPASTEREYMM